MMRKTIRVRLLAAVISVAMVATMTPMMAFATEVGAVGGAGAESGIQLHNPTVETVGEESISTWDCIYFGNYKQGDSVQPIKWRVLEVKDTDDDGQIDDAFLLADRVLESQTYHTEWANVTWETCTLRNWLNNDFLNTAFTSAEQNAIRKTSVVNNNNPQYNTEGGNDTEDKVFILSIEEVRNSSYGFASDTSRKAGYGYWLRSPGWDTHCAAYVNEYGGVLYNGPDAIVDAGGDVRPALHINLQSSCWSYAGSVSSDGTEKEGITEVILLEGNYEYTGSPITPEPVVRCGDIVLEKDTDYTVSYSDNVNLGTAKAIVSGAGTYTGSAVKTFRIWSKLPDEITLSRSAYVYDGTEKKPVVSIEGLEEGKDFSVSYKKNVNAGVAVVKISGESDYVGTKTEYFTIEMASIADADITLQNDQYVFNGNAQTPAATVTIDGIALVEGTDFTASYKNNKDVGTAMVTIKGAGNYRGTITRTFTINPKGTTIKAPARLTKGFTAKWAKSTAANASGYQVRYALKSSMAGAKIKTVKGYGVTSTKVTKLKAKKKYYIQVRTYKTVNGKTYYSVWSGKKAVTTK